MMRHTRNAALAGGTLAVLLMVAGCEDEGPAEQAGEQVDEAAEDVQDSAEDAADSAGDAAEEGADAAEDQAD